MRRRRQISSFAGREKRCCAAAVGRVRQNRTLTTHPMLGSRTRTFVRACQLVAAQYVAAFAFTLVHARARSSTLRNKMPWELSL